MGQSKNFGLIFDMIHALLLIPCQWLLHDLMVDIICLFAKRAIKDKAWPFLVSNFLCSSKRVVGAEGEAGASIVDFL